MYLCRQMKPKSVSQYDVINALRLPLIVLVTYAHSYGGVIEGYSVLGSGWDSYEVMKIVISQTLVKMAMPMFFVISGYLFFANVEKFNKTIYWQKIRRRVRTLLIPYIIWNLLMSVKLKTFCLSIFWEPANMPLWFLRDLIIVSLLTPIIYIGVKKINYWIFILLIPIYLTGIWAIQPGPNPYAICFFTLGAYLSIQKINLVKVCLKMKKVAYLLTVFLALAMVLAYPSIIYSLLLLFFRVVSIVAVFCLACRILSQANKRIPKTACDASYFIYLAHYVFFFSFIDTAFFSLFGNSTTSLCLHYLLCPLVKVAIFVAIYYIYRKTYTYVSKILEIY